MVIIALVFAAAWIWALGLKEDKADTQTKMDKILAAYPDFNEAVDNYSEMRNQFYEYKEDLYIETLISNAEAWNTFIASYSDSIQAVEDAAQDLKENCQLEYGDVNVSTKCETFKVNYEAAHNYYISDAKLYNSLVDEYDEYNSENGGIYPSVNKAELLIYTDYIDYDEDGEYFGKEEVTENE